MATETTPLQPGGPKKRSIRGQMFVLSLVRICEPIAFLSVFPFVNQMIHDLGTPAAKVGYKAGQIEGSFALAQFFTAFHWSRLSDRIGRKPVLIIGLSGVCLSAALFGMSQSFWAMLLARFASGALSGNIAVIKSILGELTDESNEARAFTMLPVGYAFGSLIGPTIGGSLTNPAEKFPGLFGNVELFIKFPYSLPCFVAALFPLTGALLTYFFLKETSPSRSLESTKNTQGSKEDTSVRSVLTSQFFVFCCSNGLLVFLITSIVAIIPLVAFQSPENGGLGLSEQSTGFVLTARGTSTMFFQLFIFPYLSKRLGNVQVLQLAAMVFSCLFIGFPIVTWLGREYEYSSNRGVIIATALVPTIAFGSFGSITMVCVNLLANTFAPSRELLGATNGLVQSINALIRSIAPVISTSLFSITIESPIISSNFILGHGNLFWMILFLIASTGALLSFAVKPPTVTWRDKERMKMSIENDEDDEDDDEDNNECGNSDVDEDREEEGLLTEQQQQQQQRQQQHYN